MNEPLVTVNILSFNRKDDLRLTLQKVFEQDYQNIEVVVVDNASTDGTLEMVKNEFSSIQLIQLQKNIGIAGWNEGFKIARGEFILVLDDDSYPDKNSIKELVQTAQSDKHIGVVGSKIKNLLTGRIEIPGNEGDRWFSFIGCGALIRKDIFTSIGLFSETLFLYFHEIDFSFRLKDSGYKINLSQNSVIFHSNSPKNRSYLKNIFIDQRKIYYDIRNTIFLLLSYFSFDKIAFRLIRVIVGRIYFGIKNHLFLKIILGIADGIKLFIFSKNKPSTLKLETQEYFKYGAIFGGFYFWNGNYGNKSHM